MSNHPRIVRVALSRTCLSFVGFNAMKTSSSQASPVVSLSPIPRLSVPKSARLTAANDHKCRRKLTNKESTPGIVIENFSIIFDILSIILPLLTCLTRTHSNSYAFFDRFRRLKFQIPHPAFPLNAEKPFCGRRKNLLTTLHMVS
jgi:hypothetical protein